MAELILRFGPVYIFVTDKMLQPGVAYRFAEGFEFRPGALDNEVDAAIRQVTHSSGDFKSGGDGFCRVTEPDALHATRIKNFHATTVRDWRLLRHVGMKPEPDA